MSEKLKTKPGGRQVASACDSGAIAADLRSASMMDEYEIFRDIFMNAPENLAVFDSVGRVVKANPHLLNYLGRSADEVEGKTPDEINAHLNLNKLAALVGKSIALKEPLSIEVQDERETGPTSLHQISVVPVIAADGSCDRGVAFGRNIANIQKLTASIAETESHLQAAIRVLPDIFWVKDLSGRYIICNEHFEEFANVMKGGLLGRRAEDVFEADQVERHNIGDKLALEQDEVVQYKVEVNAASGKRHFEVQKVAIRDDHGNPTGLLGVAHEVTRKHILQEELRAREREYRQLVEHLPDCLARYNRDIKPIYRNGPLLELLRRVLGDLPVKPGVDLMAEVESHPSLKEMYDGVERVFETGESCHLEGEFQCLDGSVIIHEIRLVPEFNEQGDVVSVMGVGRDITAKKKAMQALAVKERELEKLAYTDSLTGLANRATFAATLREQIEKAVSRGESVALLTLDIDRFKAVNDTLGHSVGDALLQEFARRLERASEGEAVWLGRLGGDEFALIVPDEKNGRKAEVLAEKIIRDVAAPVVLNDNAVNVSTSIGITFGPEDSECESELFKFSDLALYQAKSLGRGQACRYTDDMSKIANQRFEVEALINEGLGKGQFEAYFQPKVNLTTGAICGAEALCRWEHPQRGFIPPDAFIPVAEESGQIIDIGELVLRQSCEFAVACNGISETPFTVAVNVSARQLLFGGFLGRLGQCLEETGCKAEWLELEITESLLLNDSTFIIDVLNSITALGILISIDDFGTGYSALSYLQSFPIGGLKIDQSFIRGMEKDRKQEVLVRAILAMAQGLELKTVAEGVESEKIAKKLKALGCELGQGYFWQKPIRQENFMDLLSSSVSQCKYG